VGQLLFAPWAWAYSTLHPLGYSWEGVRQVCATLLGARHVPERLCGGHVYLWRYQVLDLYFRMRARVPNSCLALATTLRAVTPAAGCANNNMKCMMELCC